MKKQARKKHLSDYEKVEALIFAEVHGDEAAVDRYGISDRTLRNYRALARDESSAIAKIFRDYANAIHREEAAPAQFGAWLEDQVRGTGKLLIEKARAGDPRNPETLRVLNEHVQTLLNHATALQYIANLFQQDDEPGDSARDAAGAVHSAFGRTGTADGAPAQA